MNMLYVKHTGIPKKICADKIVSNLKTKQWGFLFKFHFIKLSICCGVGILRQKTDTNISNMQSSKKLMTYPLAKFWLVGLTK